MNVVLSCPGCQKEMQVPPHGIGRSVLCPHCGMSFDAALPAVAAESEIPVAHPVGPEWVADSYGPGPSMVRIPPSEAITSNNHRMRSVSVAEARVSLPAPNHASRWFALLPLAIPVVALLLQYVLVTGGLWWIVSW